LLNGDYPYLPEVADNLAEQFGLSVKMIETEKVSSATGQPFPARFAPVLGLALKEVK
jgi:type IV pilus assembly protein PilM